MSKIKNETTEDLQTKLVKYKKALAECDSPSRADVWKQIISLIDIELAERSQKKSEIQPIEKSEQLPTKPELEKWAQEIDMEQRRERENKAAWYEEKRQKAAELNNKFRSALKETKIMGNDKPSELFQKSLKTVEAPVFTTEADLINVKLVNGDTATYNRGQIKSLTRKYFRNVLDGEAWKSGIENRLLGSAGFRNLCAYLNAWKTLDEKAPEFKDVLIYYHQHDKEGKAIKDAQKLYNKIVALQDK